MFMGVAVISSPKTTLLWLLCMSSAATKCCYAAYYTQRRPTTRRYGCLPLQSAATDIKEVHQRRTTAIYTSAFVGGRCSGPELYNVSAEVLYNAAAICIA